MMFQHCGVQEFSDHPLFFDGGDDDYSCHEDLSLFSFCCRVYQEDFPCRTFCVSSEESTASVTCTL